MKIRSFLGAIIVGLSLLSIPRAMATDLVFHVELTELSPVLRDLVTKEFPKEPNLKGHLDPVSVNDQCQDLPAKFRGATVRVNPKGDLGALISIDGCRRDDPASAPLHIFLKRQGKWTHVGDTRISGRNVDVLRTKDRGFYRLDLGPEHDCERELGHLIDGIVFWTGQSYVRLHPCPDPAHPVAVLSQIRMAKLSPMLANLVRREFPRYEDLREYLDPIDTDLFSYDERCREPMGIFSGAVAPVSPKGDLAAFILVEGCGWSGNDGGYVYFFLKRKDRWKRAGDYFFADHAINVLSTTDRGFYRLDLGHEHACDARTNNDGLMVWNGKEYTHLHPCAYEIEPP
jgi:hypothetical protein